MSDDSSRPQAQKDLLWGMYSDMRAHARHAETLRANAVNIVLVVASALVAVIAADGNLRRDELPVSLLVIFIGVIGLAFAAAYTELYQRNRRRAERFRAVLDERFFVADDPTITEVLNASDERHQATSFYRWTRRLTGSTQRFWLVVPALVIVTGTALVIAIAAA
ncbi:hypothetical protein [Acrocarpospora macrocephala]|uniref:hypothetical protein n=1 Tax=Acrocarpospora macrocephala TaxID=150177 RepID=UPI0012D322A6|nr:hypothetical protein [Acrocarpospora macrocephala]